VIVRDAKPMWNKSLLDRLGEFFRFVGWTLLATDGLLLAIFSLWFVSRFLWHTLQWMDRVLFSQPW
jgi:hypothetical protein